MTQNSARDVVSECEPEKVDINVSDNAYEVDNLDDGCDLPQDLQGVVNVTISRFCLLCENIYMDNAIREHK